MQNVVIPMTNTLVPTNPARLSQVKALAAISVTHQVLK